jgi:hypothetical protein
MRPVHFLAVALLLPACVRDLEVPPENTLALADPFPAVAPREAMVIQVSGGAPPYAFAFAPGGAASGPDASVDAATGAYQAGSVGPAVDVVQVRDAGGALREAHVTVGPPLQVAPRSAFVAPGGVASFVAIGGKAPYLLELVAGVGRVQGTDFEAPASGGCTGVVSAPAQVALRLRDATSAAPIDLAVSVGRGLDLFPAAGSGDVRRTSRSPSSPRAASRPTSSRWRSRSRRRDRASTPAGAPTLPARWGTSSIAWW